MNATDVNTNTEQDKKTASYHFLVVLHNEGGKFFQREFSW
jgi:hypothetical protein